MRRTIERGQRNSWATIKPKKYRTNRLKLRLWPNLVEQLHKRVVNHEGNGNIQTNTSQSWHGSLIKPVTKNFFQYCQVFIISWNKSKVFVRVGYLRSRSFEFPNSNHTVDRVLIFGRFQTLHSSFDDVQGRVSENGDGTGYRTECTHDWLRHRRIRIAFSVPIFTRFHNIKSHRLIGTLLHDGGR